MIYVSIQEERKLRVGIVGLGKMGLLHACILNVLPDVRLVALCDKSNLIRKVVKKLFAGAQIIDDLDGFSGLHLDAVYITTPIPSHFPLAKMVYSKNIAESLFIEKTLASNYEDGRQLCGLCRECAGVGMVGYMKRFSVTFRKAKDLLNGETLGKLVSFDAHAYSSDFSDVKSDPKISAARGGVLRDLGSHVIDLALWFFDDLVVQSVEMKSQNAFGSEDSAHFETKGSDDLEGRFDISWCEKGYRMPEFGLTIRGNKGIIVVDDYSVSLDLHEGESRRWYRQDLGDSVFFLIGDPEYSREDEHFARSILNGGKVESSFETASKVDYVIDQVKRGAVKA